MAKRRSCLMSLIRTIFVFILIIVLLVVGVCVFINYKFGINVPSLVNDVRILNQEVKINKIAPNVYTAEDLDSAKKVTDISLEGLITVDENGNYEVNADKVSKDMHLDVKLSDRQIAAMIDNVLESEAVIESASSELGDLKEYGFKLIQVQFSNKVGNSVDINVVFKFDLTPIKEQMIEFPLDKVKSIVPESLYFSSTVTLTKIGTGFDYTTVGKSLTVNNLSQKQTEEVFETLNLLAEFGTSTEFAKMTGDVFVNALIGSSESAGLTSDLASVGASSFDFVSENGENYYVIQLDKE